MLKYLLISLFAYRTINAQPQGPAAHVLTGSTLPIKCSARSGDIFFKLTSPSSTSGELYQCKTPNTWTAIAVGAIGPTGPSGPTGPAGSNGVTSITGTAGQITASGPTGAVTLSFPNTDVNIGAHDLNMGSGHGVANATGTNDTSITLNAVSTGQRMVFSAGGSPFYAWMANANGSFSWTLGKNGTFGVSANTNPGFGPDIGITRQAAGLWAVSEGTAVPPIVASNYRDISWRHNIAAGPAPTVSAGGGGTAGAIVGADESGKVTVGTSVATGSITILLGTAYANDPGCTATDETSISTIVVGCVGTTTTLTLSAYSRTTGLATNFGASDKVSYQIPHGY